MKNFHLEKGPFLKCKNNSDKIMLNLLIALLPIILFSFYKNGIYLFINGYANVFQMFYPLLFVLIGGISTFVFETLYHKFILHKSFKDSIKGNYALIPGIFLSLILPLNTPISILIVGCLITSVIKMLYGGFGHNIFNPALIGCLFIMALYSGNIGSYVNSYEVDVISSATPLTNVVMVDKINYQNVITPYGSLWTFFFGMIPGSVGETCSFLIILSFIYLAITKTIKVRIPLFYIGTVFVLTLFIGRMNGLSSWYPLFQVLSGGLLFGAVFMATDPVTSPVTKIGQSLYGILLGILTVVFRMFTSAPEGVMTSILTLNMFVFIIDKIGYKLKDKKHIIIFYLIIIGMIFMLTLVFKNSINNEKVDSNFEVINTKVEDNKKIYIVNQKGNGGNINIEITLEDGKVVSYTVLSHNETPAYYDKVEKEDYINKLVQNSSDLNNVDTVSGATISSKALKKALENVLALEGK